MTYMFWHFFWHIYSDNLSDVLSGILSGIYSDTLSGIYSYILSVICSDILSGSLSDILFGMCSGPGVLHSIRSWQRGWRQQRGGGVAPLSKSSIAHRVPWYIYICICIMYVCNYIYKYIILSSIYILSRNPTVLQYIGWLQLLRHVNQPFQQTSSAQIWRATTWRHRGVQVRLEPGASKCGIHPIN